MGHFLPHDLSGLFSSKWWGSYSPMIPWSQQVGEHPSYASTFYLHDTATSPTFWLSTWQSQLPVSAESAADLEDPWSKPPRPCQVASSKTRTDHHTLPAEFISAYARLPLSITAEFSFDEPTVAQIYTAIYPPVGMAANTLFGQPAEVCTSCIFDTVTNHLHQKNRTPSSNRFEVPLHCICSSS